jgi:hypothetical protein
MLRGRDLNLFDPDAVEAGTRRLLLDLNGVKSTDFKVLPAACRVRDEMVEGKTLRFRADSIGDTNGVIRIAAPSAPVEVLVGGRVADSTQYDHSMGTLRLRFPNSTGPVPVEIRLAR